MHPNDVNYIVERCHELAEWVNFNAPQHCQESLHDMINDIKRWAMYELDRPSAATELARTCDQLSQHLVSAERALGEKEQRIDELERQLAQYQSMITIMPERRS